MGELKFGSRPIEPVAAGAIPPAPGTLAPGSDFGAYRVTRRIGAGSFGDVYLAVHRLLRRQVALKVIAPNLAASPEAVALFLREARVVAQFDHPNIVTVYDAGQSDEGLLYMAMRYVAWGSLDDLMRTAGPLPKRRALELLRDCGLGLAAIHNLGLVHRDLKPANILLEADDRACLTDLGLACFQREHLPGVDGDKSSVGTPVYMAPEQLTGEVRASRQTDFYALGVTFLALLSGVEPMAGLSLNEVVRHTLSGNVFDMCATRAEWGEGLLKLLRQLTARDPAARPADAAALLLQVDALLAEAQGRHRYRFPKERAAAATVAAAHARLRRDPFITVLLDALPGPALVLNDSRQIVACNAKAAELLGVSSAEALLGRRPGEVVGCQDAARESEGCGHSAACPFCGLGGMFSEIEQGRATPVEGECRLRGSQNKVVFDFAFRLSGLSSASDAFLLVALRDVSAEKRRHVLERSLVANLLDTAGMVRALSESAAKGGTPAANGARELETRRLLTEASQSLMDEAVFQQHLMAAETGELRPLRDECPLAPLLADVCAWFRRSPLGAGRRLALKCPAELRAYTDGVLLQRAVHNLVKNALEASAPGEEITVTAVPGEGGGGEIRVHNAQVMPEAVQEQVFRRSFSTKAVSGRGIGTHAARLFIEGCLGGQVGFTSLAPDGTTFWIRLPARTTAG